MELRVDFPRLQQDVEELACIGRDAEDFALYRMAMSPAHMQAVDWLKARLTQARLEVRQDEALNVFGVLGGELGGPSVLTGSHLDSVPGGGHLDGALGVVAGLECLRRLRELELPLRRSLELIAFNDEEGRFGGMLGSQAIAGLLTPEMVLSAVDRDGVFLRQLFQDLGLDALQALRAQRARETVHSFVEMHIEQGPVLDTAGVTIGAVGSIVGLRRVQASLTGQPNHAGTTPMNLRKDALQGFAQVATRLEQLALGRENRYSRITIGQLQLSPGAANVIPGRVQFSLDVRANEPQELDELLEAARLILFEVANERELQPGFEVTSRLEPVSCDSTVVQLIEDTAQSLGLSVLNLPSGAAHDTQMMAALGPVGMIFVPSAGGRSHSAAEWTGWEQIEAGANTLLNVLYQLSSAR